MSLTLFALLFWAISFTPGPNMLLVLGFAASAGWQRTMPLIFGAVLALVGVAFVCGVGVGAILATNERVFGVFMCACACYLGFLAFNMWHNAQNVDFRAQKNGAKLGRLFVYGVTSCLSNAKAWAAFVALLPPFLDRAEPLNSRFALILCLIALIEFANMCLYMFGGLVLRRVLATKAALLQRLSAVLIAIVAVMMVVSVV